MDRLSPQINRSPLEASGRSFAGGLRLIAVLALIGAVLSPPAAHADGIRCELRKTTPAKGQPRRLISLRDSETSIEYASLNLTREFEMYAVARNPQEFLAYRERLGKLCQSLADAGGCAPIEIRQERFAETEIMRFRDVLTRRTFEDLEDCRRYRADFILLLLEKTYSQGKRIP